MHQAANPPPNGGRRLLYLLLVVFVALHQDFWAWHDAEFVLGLPVAMTYHLLYCLAAAGLMALLIRFAWPRDLATDDTEDGGVGVGR